MRLYLCFQDTDASAELCKYFEQRRQQQQIAGNVIRRATQLVKQNASAKEEAKKAVADLKRAKRQHDAQRELSNRSDAQLKALKNFSAEMLGQGLVNGGLKKHLMERMDFMDRVKQRFPPLRPTHENDWGAFKINFDKMHRRTVGPIGKAYGAWFLERMKDLIELRRNGSLDALDKFMDCHVTQTGMFMSHHFEV